VVQQSAAPQCPVTLPAGKREEPSVRALFAAPLRAGTILVWGFAFLVFLSTYALTAWFPTVLVELGFSPTEAPAGSALIGLGGIVSGLVVVLLAPRFGTPVSAENPIHSV